MVWSPLRYVSKAGLVLEEKKKDVEKGGTGVIRRGSGRVEPRGFWLYMAADIPSPSNLSFTSRLNRSPPVSERQGKNLSFNFLESDGLPIRE